MVSPILACLALAIVQETEPISASPFDRVMELEITGSDEPAIEGHGPTAFAEYEVEFDGTLHVWATSDLDLFLQVDDAAEARTLGSDDNSGGGTTPYLALEVHAGDWLVVLVAGAPGSTGSLSLHLISAPESDVTRAAAMAAREALQESARLVGEGSQAEARELLSIVSAEIGDTVGAASSQAVTEARSKMGTSMYRMGDLPGALVLDKAVLAAFERSLPRDHPDLLRARMDLAISMHKGGDMPGARANFELALASCERTLPEDHPDLLHVRGNLATAMYESGDLDGARSLRESVFAGYERTLHEDHPALLLAGGNLAISMGVNGDLAGARALRERVLAAYERTQPEDHPDRLLAAGNLATSRNEMGDLAGARALYESVLAGYERALPDDHPDLLIAKGNLAFSMDAMGDWAGARALRESILAAYELAMPEDHPGLLAARAQLAISLSAMGDRAGARALRESVLASYERTLPEDHPDLSRLRESLASAMYQMGDFAGARALEESILADYERILPKDHPDLLRVRGNLAASMQATGDLAGARALKESVLAGCEVYLPEDHPSLLGARGTLALSMGLMGDLAGAHDLLPAQLRGMRSRVLAALALAPRQARQTVASEDDRHSEVLFLSASAGPAIDRSAFELTETMRLVAAEAARSLARFESDPELAPFLNEAAEIRRSLNDLVAGAAREESGSEGLSAELTRLSLKRDALEREASRRLAERGVATQPVGAGVLTAALDSGDVAIGYRRITIRHLDSSSGEILPPADHLLAHALDSEGALHRIDLGPASELEELASVWRAALGAPIRRHGALDAVGTSVADASRGIAAIAAPGGSATKTAELAAGRVLRSRILDPVLAEVQVDVTRIFVCADDLLFLLPLDALPFDAEAEGLTRLGDRMQIVNGVSFARLLAPLPAMDGEPSLLSLGGVDYDSSAAAPEGLSAVSAPIESGAMSMSGDAATRSATGGGFQNLIQARHEAERIATLFEDAFETGPALLTRGSTTKATLFESAPGKRYLHLATHGWFAPESVRSTQDAQPAANGLARMGIEERVFGLAPMTLCGLALAGANRGRDSLGRVPGILTAEELCSLDLSQCELAVLSACETNVGIRRAGQGIQSLQSALYAAGARTSITSLWKVDDAATRRLMEVFYTNLWIDNLPKAEALWQAKQALRDEGHPPAHWAGWVLTGDPE